MFTKIQYSQACKQRSVISKCLQRYSNLKTVHSTTAPRSMCNLVFNKKLRPRPAEGSTPRCVLKEDIANTETLSSNDFQKSSIGYSNLEMLQNTSKYLKLHQCSVISNMFNTILYFNIIVVKQTVSWQRNRYLLRSE